MSHTPPKLGRRLLLRFLREDLREEVEGDLEEKFYSLSKQSPRRAKLNYWFQVFNYLRPFAIRKSKTSQINHYGMYQNYVKVGWRNLFRNKRYVIINTVGLGISLACCITAYLMLAYDWEFDSFYDDKKVANIYTIHTRFTDNNGQPSIDVQAPIMLGPVASTEISGIERYCRYIFGYGSMRYKEKVFNESLSFADSTFFDLFDIPLVSGSHRSFKEKNSIFLSEEMARKYFGDEEPVGKLMVMNFMNETEIEAIVGGVFRKPPLNSSFFFDAMMRMENYIAINKLDMEDWSDWRNPTTFLEVSSPGNAGHIGKQMSRYIPQRNKLRADIVVQAYELVPFKAPVKQENVRGSWVFMRVGYGPTLMFGSMAMLIVLIACFNLTNTSIAMTAKRLREVGVRKVVGATRVQIVSQFMFETMMIIVLSIGVGLLVAQWIVPAFYEMWGLPFGLKDIKGLNFFIAVVVLGFIAALIAGVYPALFSSKFKPVALLKGTTRVNGTNPLTRTLVAVQFALSVTVLIAGVVFIQNSRFQEHFDFGYDRDELLALRIKGEKEYEAMEAMLLRSPDIVQVGASDGNIGQNTYQTPVTVDTTRYDTQVLGVGRNFFETMGFKLLEGRFLSGNIAEGQPDYVVANRMFIQKTGIKDPIGKAVTLHGGKVIIVGVVENHVDNLFRSKDPEPFLFYAATPNQYNVLLAKTDSDSRAKVMKVIEVSWKQLFPDKPFDCLTQEDVLLSKVREVNSNFGKMFLFITVLAAILSVSGIFALASLNVARRTKEIGIRKALGASMTNIVGLMNREFVIVLSLSAIAGGAGGYYATEHVMSSFFANHVPVGITPIIICSAVVFAIGTLTTSATIMKAARENPVKTLRND